MKASNYVEDWIEHSWKVIPRNKEKYGLLMLGRGAVLHNIPQRLSSAHDVCGGNSHQKAPIHISFVIDALLMSISIQQIETFYTPLGDNPPLRIYQYTIQFI